MDRSCYWLAVTAFAFLWPGTLLAGPEYRISSGDVLELSVVAVPELQQRITVSPDGSAAFPMIADIAVEGRTLVEVREEVRGKLSRVSVPRNAGRGMDETVVFGPGQIGLTIAEYRPIYITGDVTQPGEQRFRLGMTAREAVVVAGGYGSHLTRAGGSAPLAAIDLQADYSLLLTDLAREQAHLLRLQSEFDRDGPPQARQGGAMNSGALPNSEVARLEALRGQMHDDASEKDQAHLRESVKAAEKRLGILAEQRNNAAAVLKDDQAEFDRANELFRQGMSVVGRVSEARRTVLFSASHLLELDSIIATAERDRSILERNLAKYREDRRATVLSELQDARSKVQMLETKLMAATQKMTLTLPVSHLVAPGSTGASPVQITIFRRSGANRGRIEADQDTELMPGDTVEVSLRASGSSNAGEGGWERASEANTR